MFLDLMMIEENYQNKLKEIKRENNVQLEISILDISIWKQIFLFVVFLENLYLIHTLVGVVFSY